MNGQPRTRRSKIGIAWALAATGLVTVAAGSSAATAAPAGDLFISEYIEGSSNNKAIEIYNGTDVDVDLAAGGYEINMYFNGSVSSSSNVPLTGTVAAGDVYVVADNDAGPAILAEADQTSTNNFFNGDDAVVLSKAGALVDVIGQIGFDPGSQWGTGDASTQNNTIRRAASICAGDTDGSDEFIPATEWVGYAQDTFDGLGAHTSDCGDPVEPTILINEFDSDQTSTDSAEFIELTDGGVGGTDLSGLTVVLYNGSNNLSYDAIDLDGVTTNADGYAVICANAATVANCDVDVSPDTNWLQNGADAIALYEADATDFPNGTAVTLDGLVDAVVYDTNDSDDPELLVLLEAGQAQINENEGGSATTVSGQRCPDSSGLALQTDTYELWAPTPGVENACEIVVPPLDCAVDVPITLISTIQGAGSVSPMVGDTVVVEAVVTAILTDLNRVIIQEEVADDDGNLLTSEGIAVFGGTLPDGLTVGTTVRVEGTVSEYETSSNGVDSSLTEIAPSAIVACDDPAIAIDPTVVTLPLPNADALEAVESMLVTLPQDLVISEYFNYDRFGEVVVSSERLLTPTAEFEPGPDATAATAANELDRLTIDDGRGNQNPDPAIHPGNGGVFDLNNLFRGGDTITGATGIIEDTFGLFRLQPTTYGTFTEQNPRTAAPDDVGGDITVASFNVLNYFTTLDDGTNDICGPAQNLECRGADEAEELVRQRDKIVAAITAIDADVVGLIEIENNVNDDAVIDLVDSLNAVNGAGTYDAIDTGTIGDDAIKVAFIYQPAAVTPVGDYALLDGSVDPRFIDSKNRPVLAQTFSDADGGMVTVAVNHLKSKGSSCVDVGDPDATDGSGNCNGVRTEAAEALVDWLATDPTGSGDPDVLVIGDLNSYDKETPIDAIIAGADDTAGTADDYADLLAQFQGEDAYTYVFDGQFGYLDHALANTSLLGQVTGTTAWHINADEPDLIDYDISFKKDAQDAIYAPDPYRSSDHDPVIVGLDLDAPVVVGELDIDSALIVLGRRGGGKAVIRGSVPESFSSCPSFALSIDGQQVTDRTMFRLGSRCVAIGWSGIIFFDLNSSEFTAIVTLPSSFSLDDDTVDFGLLLDDVEFATQVDGRSAGRTWFGR
ncbi:ExeM/NucH family extracellular endonuclease [Ilumatobacter coccineus]|uniref:Putative nuclease n=1 Tax=Ilumatobacter coccineus (strain NBRC 103263 / KCTC 29153 / YM16-304) TaxID=1313172 RepID=A0A6C7EIG6_ILUCY|nr:ExeM/NucH family extracellular endonuclease [Ilumatobacter coccineus]BAN03766.1 putative nuclease [Ilumatobacter coccineus YM16-304]